MPEELDPAWEYAETDYELVAMLEGNGRFSAYDRLELGTLRSRSRGYNDGMRKGAGNPDRYSGVINEKQVEETLPFTVRAEARPKRCQCLRCSVVFTARRERPFCSHRCSALDRWEGHVPLRARCLVCGASCKWAVTKFCGSGCADWYHKRVKSPTVIPRGANARGVNGTCPSCGDVRYLFRRGVCKPCYQDVRKRLEAPVKKRHRPWGAKDAGRLLLETLRRTPLARVCILVHRTKNEIVCKRQAWRRTGRVSTNPLNGDAMPESARELLPPRRRTLSQKVRVGGQTVHYSFGLYPDGRPGELWIEVAKAGAALRAWAGEAAMMVSIALQHGTPLETVVNLFIGTRNQPCGTVEGHDRIKFCTSIMDCIARDLAITFLQREDLGDSAGWNVLPVPISGSAELPPPVEGQTCVCREKVQGTEVP